MKKHITFVTKDKGGFLVAMPVAQLLQDECDLTIIADPAGITFELWNDAGFSPVLNSKLPYKCDLVIATLGAPIDLENQLALEANKRGIGLVFIEDIWGAHTRSSATPDYVFTLDAFGADMAEQKFSEAIVFSIGSPAFDHLKLYFDKNQADVRKQLGLSINEKIVLLAGVGQADEMIDVTINFAEAIKGKGLTVIPRLHPKLQKTAPYVYQICKYVLQNIDANVRWFNESNMADLIFAADMVVSTYSTTLVEACYLRRQIISFMSELHQESMKQNLGIDLFPPVSLGCGAYAVSSESLAVEIDNQDPEFFSKQLKYFNADEKNAKRIHQYILKILD